MQIKYKNPVYIVASLNGNQGLYLPIVNAHCEHTDSKLSSNLFWSCTYFLSGQIQSPSLTRKLFPDILVPTSLAANCSSLARKLWSLPYLGSTARCTSRMRRHVRHIGATVTETLQGQITFTNWDSN